MMASAWGVSRDIDALEITTGHGVNVKHLTVSRCLSNGKGTLVVIAFEPRITLTIPQESGTGGAGCWCKVPYLPTHGNQLECDLT